MFLSSSPSNFSALVEAISHPRLSNYRSFFSTADDAETLGLYQWNEDTCGALFRAISVVEIVLRNQFHKAMGARYGSMGSAGSRDWYNHIALSGHSRQKVQEITHRRHHQQWLARVPTRSPDDVVSKLTFGFWPHLLDVMHDSSNSPLDWGAILVDVLPGHRQRQSTYWAKQSPRDALFARLDLCNEIRNRIAHHEPIWKLGPLMSETRARLHTKPTQVLPAPSTPQESLERLQLYYERVTELMQWLSPTLASAYRSGEVDARCRWLLAERTLDDYRQRQPSGKARIGDTSHWLSSKQFSQACAALPLVSLDFCLLRPSCSGATGLELLLGLRNNRPAQGWWFTPGGRIRKNEQLASASARIALDELGLPATALSRAHLMGAWDHLYADSAFDPAVSTHYVNLPHWLALSQAEADALTLPQGPDQQHARWQWLPLEQAVQNESVHAYVRVYARWLLDNAL